VTNHGFRGNLVVAEVEQENSLEVRAELETPFLAIQEAVAVLTDRMSGDVLDQLAKPGKMGMMTNTGAI